MSGGILRFPWTTQPQSPVDIDPKWLARGLVFLNLGNGVYWKKDKGWSTIATITGGPKTNASKFGKVKGFGSTNGTGSTDRIDLPAIPMATGFRSIVAHLFANSTGGGTFGRRQDGRLKRHGDFATERQVDLRRRSGHRDRPARGR